MSSILIFAYPLYQLQWTTTKLLGGSMPGKVVPGLVWGAINVNTDSAYWTPNIHGWILGVNVKLTGDMQEMVLISTIQLYSHCHARVYPHLPRN